MTRAGLNQLYQTEGFAVFATALASILYNRADVQLRSPTEVPAEVAGCPCRKAILHGDFLSGRVIWLPLASVNVYLLPTNGNGTHVVTYVHASLRRSTTCQTGAEIIDVIIDAVDQATCPTPGQNHYP